MFTKVLAEGKENKHFCFSEYTYFHVPNNKVLSVFISVVLQ